MWSDIWRGMGGSVTFKLGGEKWVGISEAKLKQRLAVSDTFFKSGFAASFTSSSSYPADVYPVGDGCSYSSLQYQRFGWYQHL